jgi:hypothetical protein
MSNKVLYENILKCQNFTEDSHWKEIFYSCACNKFPRGIKYDHQRNLLYVRYNFSGKLQNETISIPSHSNGTSTKKSQSDMDEDNELSTTKETYKILMYIFRELLSLRSEDDIKHSKNVLEDIRKQNEVDLDCTWKKLKPRSVRNHILMNYAITQVELFELEKKQAIVFYRLLQLGFQFKQLSSDDVKYKKGKILDISGVEFDEDLNFFTLMNNFSITSKTDNNMRSNKTGTVEKSIDKWVKLYKQNYILDL